eukprot:1346737-Rhodomonas_salina.1
MDAYDTVERVRWVTATGLRKRYAKAGTDIAHGATRSVRQVCSWLAGTRSAYTRVMRCPVLTYAYGATRAFVARRKLKFEQSIRALQRAWYSLCPPYAMSGTRPLEHPPTTRCPVLAQRMGSD